MTATHEFAPTRSKTKGKEMNESIKNIMGALITDSIVWIAFTTSQNQSKIAVVQNDVKHIIKQLDYIQQEIKAKK